MRHSVLALVIRPPNETRGVRTPRVGGLEVQPLRGNSARWCRVSQVLYPTLPESNTRWADDGPAVPRRRDPGSDPDPATGRPVVRALDEARNAAEFETSVFLKMRTSPTFPSHSGGALGTLQR